MYSFAQTVPSPASGLLLNARRERAEVVPVLLLDGHDLALQPENGASPGGPSAGPRRGRVIANFFGNILAEQCRNISLVFGSISSSLAARITEQRGTCAVRQWRAGPHILQGWQSDRVWDMLVVRLQRHKFFFPFVLECAARSPSIAWAKDPVAHGLQPQPLSSWGFEQIYHDSLPREINRIFGIATLLFSGYLCQLIVVALIP